MKTKTQISFAATTKLISAFVFATRIVQSLYFLNPKFQASCHLLSLYSLVCVGPDRKPRRPVFSQRGSFTYLLFEISASHLPVRLTFCPSVTNRVGHPCRVIDPCIFMPEIERKGPTAEFILQSCLKVIVAVYFFIPTCIVHLLSQQNFLSKGLLRMTEMTLRINGVTFSL